MGNAAPSITASAYGATFAYGVAIQYASSDGLFATATVAKPSLAANDFHSLAELSARSEDGLLIVEVGWTVDRGVNGDDRPHLFVFHWVDGVATCYNGCGYHQVTGIKSGAALPTGKTKFGIRHHNGSWWIQVNGKEIGFFPDSLWGGRYTRAGLTLSFGEVAAGSGNPCTDMGNGKFANSASAAAMSGLGLFNGPAVNIDVNATKPALYTAQKTGTDKFRFGGPGAC
jgi:hypothetical protein